jgi:hypothetical protein
VSLVSQKIIDGYTVRPLLIQCALTSILVIDRKRIFWFRPKTNIRQEKAAEYSAGNEYSAQGSKHRQNVNLYKEIFFVFWVAVASGS